MAKMTPFQYVEFYDVPRCIAFRYREMLLLLQSAFDEILDDYPSSYSIYVLPEWVEDSLRDGSWAFLSNTPITCIGNIQIGQVTFDPSKRKELDASFLDSLVGGVGRVATSDHTQIWVPRPRC
jgi:hypothetical protein